MVAAVGFEVASDLGLASALAEEPAESLTFGALEPLVCLMQETPAKYHLLFGNTRGFRGRLAGFHPAGAPDAPASCHACKQLVRGARGSQLLVNFHHRPHIHRLFLR